MSILTSPQRKAVVDATEILRSADVSVDVFVANFDTGRLGVTLPITHTAQLHSPDLVTPSERIIKASYVPERALYFSEEEKSQLLHKLTRKSIVSAIIDHPEGAVLEYPETGKVLGEAVAHRFLVDPHNLVHPRKNIQYSLGDEHGGKDVICYLLHDTTSGQPLKCRKLTYKCEFIQYLNLNTLLTSYRLLYKILRIL